MSNDESATAAPSVGAPIDRVDGRLKVTGGAKYAAEYRRGERRARGDRHEHDREGARAVDRHHARPRERRA